MKKLIRQIIGVDLGRGRIATEDMHIFLYRDDKSGLAWVEDGSTGLGHSAHPNISATGSVKGMKRDMLYRIRWTRSLPRRVTAPAARKDGQQDRRE